MNDLNPAPLDKKELSRRRFLRLTGLSAVAGVTALNACSKKADVNVPANNGKDSTTTKPNGKDSTSKDPVVEPKTVSLGTGDAGVLNYMYLLEQLNAAFYIKVIESPYSNATVSEKATLTSIRDHDVAHRGFLKAALGSVAIAQVEVNFDSIDFTSHSSVLSTAKAFKDLTVSAYNGAAKLFTGVDYLYLLSKIVSVEARHAAVIRELITPNSFAGSDVVYVNGGLDQARAPKDVLSIFSLYLKTKIDASGLPV